MTNIKYANDDEPTILGVNVIDTFVYNTCSNIFFGKFESICTM